MSFADVAPVTIYLAPVTKSILATPASFSATFTTSIASTPICSRITILTSLTMSKSQQVDERLADKVKADSVGTDQSGEKVMPSAEPERFTKQEVLDDSDDDEYTTFDWNIGSNGRLRGYYCDRSKYTSARPSQCASVHPASTADKDASMETATDGGSQTVTTDYEPSRLKSQS
jgi:hypothetical protein